MTPKPLVTFKVDGFFYFKTRIAKVTVTFSVGLTYFMTPKGHDDLRGLFHQFMTQKSKMTFKDGLT